MTQTKSFYTPSWNYSMSGINWAVHQLSTGDQNSFGEDYHCTKAGVHANMIVSMAAVIEGCMRSFLRTQLLNFESLEKKYQSLEDDTLHSFESKEEIKKLEDRVNGTSKLIKKLNSRKNWLCTLKQVFKVICYKVSKPKKGAVALTKQDLAIEIIEKADWNALEGYYRVLADKKLSKSLGSVLYIDLKDLIVFRNFLVHGNVLLTEIDENGKLSFKKATKRLFSILNKRGLSHQKGDNYIESLLPHDLVMLFHAATAALTNNKIFEDDFDTNNLNMMIFDPS